MNITVFGANGRVGRKVVARLLADGHKVTAFVHNSSQLADNANLKFIKGDIHNSQDVKAALAGSDAIVSARGSWGTNNKDILAAGTRNIIAAMEAAKIKRIVSLTGAGAFESADVPKWLDKINHAILSVVAPRVLRDGEAHMQLLRDSSLDWTVLRSPVMLEKSKSGYVLAKDFPAPWATIARSDVANAIVKLVTSNDHMKSAPFIIHRSY